jgi:hypothetical protein
MTKRQGHRQKSGDHSRRSQGTEHPAATPVMPPTTQDFLVEKTRQFGLSRSWFFHIIWDSLTPEEQAKWAADPGCKYCYESLANGEAVCSDNHGGPRECGAHLHCCQEACL